MHSRKFDWIAFRLVSAEIGLNRKTSKDSRPPKENSKIQNFSPQKILIDYRDAQMFFLSFTYCVPESSAMTHNDDVIPHLCENSILHFPAKVHCALLSIFNDYSISITINIFRMEETLEVEGRYYLEEVSLTDTASSKGTISPLPIQIKPPGEYAPDGK